jgi:hypothetical protein
LSVAIDTQLEAIWWRAATDAAGAAASVDFLLYLIVYAPPSIVSRELRNLERLKEIEAQKEEVGEF